MGNNSVEHVGVITPSHAPWEKVKPEDLNPRHPKNKPVQLSEEQSLAIFKQVFDPENQGKPIHIPGTDQTI